MNSLPPVEERTLGQAFARALSQQPDKVAYIDDACDEWTYRQAFDESLCIAGGVLRAGVSAQQPVAVMLDNSLDHLFTAYGLGLTRRIQVPLNTAYKGTFLAHILNDCGARVLVIEDHYADRLALIADDLEHLEHVIVRGGDGAVLAGTRWAVAPFAALSDGPPAVEEPSSAGDLMAYMYTSGTTGLSKGVEVTHAHAYTYASREDSKRPNENDRILLMLPMFHLAGQWYGGYQSLIARATCVVQPAFSVSNFWGWIRDFQITEAVMLGAVAELLQQAEPRDDDSDNSLELAVMAPLASDMDGFRKRFGIEIGAVYGMSEIGAVLVSDPPNVVAGESGIARAGYDLRLVDEEGNDVPDDAAGELWIRAESPEVTMRGYHGLPEKTAETVVDGWIRSGDIFKRDSAGHYYFMDRHKDALRRRGENISSFEVEAALNEFPDVFESAVVAVPSALGEDEIKAVIVPRQGRDIDLVALTRFMIERVPFFMVPRYFQLADELPKTPTLKIQKHLLRNTPIDDGVWDREAAGITVSRRS